MPRPALRVATRDGAVVPDAEARWQGTDEVFFHKSQIRVGTRLINYGRTRHGTEWTVIEVKTFKVGRTGRAYASKTGGVAKLTDEVVVRRKGANETRQISFAAMSYSAIWRLA